MLCQSNSDLEQTSVSKCCRSWTTCRCLLHPPLLPDTVLSYWTPRHANSDLGQTSVSKCCQSWTTCRRLLHPPLQQDTDHCHRTQCPPKPRSEQKSETTCYRSCWKCRYNWKTPLRLSTGPSCRKRYFSNPYPLELKSAPTHMNKVARLRVLKKESWWAPRWGWPTAIGLELMRELQKGFVKATV